MRDIRGGNRMAAVDRIAVMAALNLAHELLQSKQASEQRDQQITRTLNELNRKLDSLLADAPMRGRERV
jgi:cell division protein ZapA